MKKTGRLITNKNSFGQSILDFVLAFIAIAVLSVGIVRIWVWFNANFTRRQVNYQESRIVAGLPNSYETLGKDKSVDIAAKSDNLLAVYKPLDLTEDWVFKGKASETLFGKGIDCVIDPRKACQDECLTNPACITQSEEGAQFTENCACFIKCMCAARIDPVVKLWTEQAKQLRLDAEEMRDNADELRDAADKCKWWNPFCWTRKMKKSKRQLKKAARRLDREALDADAEAANLEAKAAILKICCQHEISQDQNNCISLIKGTSCLELTETYIARWKEEISKSEEDKKELEAGVEIIGDGISAGLIYECNQYAKSSCQESCETQCENKYTTYVLDKASGKWVGTLDVANYYKCYNNCYPPCYENRRNSCCQTKKIEGESTGRNCDAPLPACSEEETADSEIKCSLALVREKFNQEILKVDTAIYNLDERIKDVTECCEVTIYKSAQEQLQCLSEKSAEESP